ncbi:hypothetical protein AK812_SmicGene44184 [Symbiodinium microadriaticum]|uniref:Uncharacterized protein n=1 Tax=Symbiodinium microadriaticum TaxID=2951 RepID=A0A1Q9BZ41_SYMMI|nr:hypothetical protein AK812_SmicGene44184 [Symbiodinium microadriaticum]CAE7214730.1 unnamed protein product [Symbiodinium microadriaticum]
MDERSEEVAHVRGKLRAAGANPRLCRELLVMWHSFLDFWPGFRPRAIVEVQRALERSDTEASFPECPQYCLDLCCRLTAGKSLLLRRRRSLSRAFAVMLLSELKLEEDSPGMPCLLKWPLPCNGQLDLQVLCLPLLQRPGGFMVCAPSLLLPSISEDTLTVDPFDAIGPSRLEVLETIDEDEMGEEHPSGVQCSALLLDLDESMLARMTPYDPVTDLVITSFVEGSPQLIPQVGDLVMAAARAWVDAAEPHDKLAYYTAAEGDPDEVLPKSVPPKKTQAAPKKRITVHQLSEQVSALANLLPGLVDQVKGVVDPQNALEKAAQPAVLPPPPAAKSGVTACCGCHSSACPPALPPPAKVPVATPAAALAPQPVLAEPGADPSACGSSSLARALTEQGHALSLLVGHLVAQGEQLDLSSSSTALSGKGTAKREKLQQELASGNSTFFLQVAQGAHRRLYPALPCPGTVEEIQNQGRLSMVTYLERQGGYGQQRSLGIFMLLLGTIADAFLRGDQHAAREHLALALSATEQATADNGKWDLAFLLTLLEEPAPTMFGPKPAAANARLRAFSPLVPQSLASVTLAYVREVDLLAQRRKDAVQPARTTTKEGEETPEPEPKGLVFPEVLQTCPLTQAAPVSLTRLLHVVVMCLNYLYQDCSFVPLELLQREPNKPQLRCMSYLLGIIRTYGSEQEGVIPSTAGRRMKVLHARLGELSEKLSSLGPVGDPYAWMPPAEPELPQTNKAEALQPYVPVRADLLQISGNGAWNPAPYLSDELWLAFVEPRSLLFGGAPPEGTFPDCSREDVEETLRLARLWSGLGLLRLEPYDPALEPTAYTRIFCAKKSSGKLRQIGDRRGPNGCESRLKGPSVFLPTGEVMTSLTLDPRLEGFALCVTDRRDFYHQMQVTPAKASTNRLRPLLPADKVRDLPAWQVMLEELASTTSSSGATPPGLNQPRFVQACFSSVLQGDHLGVEHATCAHSGLLQAGGLLDDRSRLLSRTPVFDAPCHDGLIIDDYFSISRVPRAQHADLSRDTPTLARARLDAARRLYLDNSLEGSPEKDVENAKIGTIAGAEIDSRTATLDRNLCLVGAPRSKRLALSDLTLDLCSLPATSDSLHACILGSWSSSFTFRRPCFCAFSEAFSLAPLGQIDPENPKVVPLPRKVAEELLLAAALAPLACADVAAPFSAELFATDASESKGAICSGGYARIAGPAEVLLKRADPMWEDMNQTAQGPATVSRPLGYLFDVLVIGKAAKSFHREMCQRGWVVGPLLDQEASPFFSLQTPRLLEWIFFLIEEGALRLLSVGCSLASLEKPCLCATKHKRTQGRFAKPFSSSRAGLVYAMGACLDRELRAKRTKHELGDLPIDGLERVASSDLALALDWRTDQSWHWKGQVHINILEASTVARLFLQLALRGGPLRFVNLCDSNVARCAVVKGRSPSKGLRHAARRASVLSLAAGLYHGGLFCPTRWIPADAPSRDQTLPKPVKSLGPDFWTKDRLLSDATRPRLRRWAANWLRLAFVLQPTLADLRGPDFGSHWTSVPYRAFTASIAFDSTLG